MAYTKTEWYVQAPITQESMNKIEQGIYDAHQGVETVQSDIREASTRMNGLSDRIGTNEENITALRTSIGSMTSNADDGRKAWAQVSQAITMENDAVTVSLNDRLSGAELKAENLITEITAARKEFAQSNLRAKIDDIDSNISNINGAVSTINEKFASARGLYSSVEDRFEASESNISTLRTDVDAVTAEVVEARGANGSTVNNRFNKIELQLENAKESSAKNKAFETVDSRFEEIENEIVNARGGSVSVDARLDQIDDLAQNNSLVNRMANAENNLSSLNGYMVAAQGNISDLQANKVNTSDVVNNATTDIAGKVLDARMGKTLQDQITTLQGDMSSNEDRIGALEAEVNMAAADGSRRLDLIEDDVSDLETELSDAHTSTANNASYASIDERFEAAEAKANTLASDISDVSTLANSLHTDVQTIANELGMIQNDQIRDTNSRIDTLEDEVNTISTAIGDQSDFGDRISAAETDIDNLQDAVGSLQTTVTGANGLTERMAAAESAISHTAEGSDPGGLTQRMTAVEAVASNAQSTANAAATQTSVTALTNRVISLEGKDTIIVDNATFDEETGAPQIQDPLTTADYLIKNADQKYYYWRYFGPNNGWQLISGGGGSGSGTSSGAFAESLAAITEPNENTDYFVGTSASGYLHYRFISIEGEENLVPVLIGVNPDNIKRYNITKTPGKKKTYDDTTQTWVETEDDCYYLNLYEFGYGESNASENIDEETMTPLTSIELPEGGGGSGTSTIPRVVRITPSNVTTILNEDHIYLRFFYSSVDATGETHDGTYTLRYNGGSIIDSGTLVSGPYDTTVTTGVWPDNPGLGFYQIDITEYCRLGTQTFNLSVTTNGQNIPRAWTVTIQELRLESEAPDIQLIEVGDSIQFPYVPFGTMTKTLYVEIDGVDQSDLRQQLAGAISGSPQELTIPSQPHGAHTIGIYLKAELGGEEVSTNPITRDYIWYDSEDEDAADIIIASPYRGQAISVEQYGELDIPYTIYNRLSSTSTVNYYDGETLLDTVTVTNSGTFSYAFETFGSKVIRIAVGDTSLSFNVTVTESVVDVAQVPGAVINFDPTSLTNSSANRLPTWTYNNQTYHMTVSDNFNWADDISGGGYKEDVDGKCFVIKAGTYAEFDYKMFKQAVDNTDPENPVFTSSVFDKGAEMKITFKVAAVRDASAVWFTNVGNPSSVNQMPIGIQLSAHQGWLKTSAADAAEKQAALEGTTASTNSYLYFPYSEEDKIELDISINKTGNREDFIMSYEDGVPSKAYAYETSEILYHEAGNESIIRIGSPDCDVYIYKLRIYDKALNTSEILRNFIADGKTITEKVNRYNRNSIYYDSTKPEGKRFTPYKIGSAVLDPEQLAKKMPDVKILMLEAPTFTKSKKTFVKSSLRCIHAEGGTRYPSRGDEDNWLFQGGYHSGQGTTSDNYGQSSRNVDFLFMCDGTHAPTKKKNITGYENYVSTLIKGADKSVLNPTTKSWTPTVDAEVETCLDWKGDEAKVSLTSTSIPNNYFNLKVNVASSENVNNALFQKRYDDFLHYVYESPAYKRDHRIKNDMEFVPAILFIRETDTTQDQNGNYTSHLEFNDTEWHFYSLGNIGDSKKTDYTRAYDPTDMNEFTVEISDNNTHNSQFQSGVYISNGERIVEESDSGINSMNYIWDIDIETEWDAVRDPTEHEIDHDYRVANKIKKYDNGDDVEDEFPWILPSGKVYKNYRRRTLSMEPFDGDHSFEFRYACCGDYRDGDLINETPGQDDEAQFDINRAVVEAFYKWIISASNDEFVNELAEWCVPEAVEYFYAFTHFYTMMDNRAKNCFWHFGKTGTYRQVHTPYKELLHVYTEKNGDVYTPTEDTEIDPEKTYYTEYAFDLWAYDMDTAVGIDNNGELIFPYGKEDTDYRIANTASSGYVFNGAGSIIWRRLSQSFTNQIADIFNQVNEAACFDATNLITQFDTFQDCYPEEMWRLDIERKYIRTFTGKVYDNCKLTDDGGNTKQNTRFLKEMMQGRKKYQRRQWVRDQAIYFGSKYMLNNVRNNTIEMVCYTPDAPLWNSRGYEYKENDVTKYRPFVAGDFTFYNSKLYKCIEGNTDTSFVASKWQEGVTPDYQLKLVPYQDMYLNVAVGNGNLRTPQRAVAGQEYTIDCTANMNETRVYIYAGSYIQAISGLAPFYIGANIFSSAARLKKLDLGTDNPTYHNTNLKSLTILPNMPILEELNIKNCDNLNTPINLSESNNLKIVEAEGSIIPSLSLPAYSSIETLHLPSTVNILSLQSARRLTDFYMRNKTTGLDDYTSLINMNITDSDYSANINWLDIASAALPHLNTLYLQSLQNASINDVTDLEPFAQKKAALETQYDEQGNLINKLNLSGLISVTGFWSEIEKNNYESIWPYLTLGVIDDPQHKTVKHRLTYTYEIDGVEHTYSIYVNNNASVIDIFTQGVTGGVYPTKASTAEFTYTFGDYDQGEYIEFSGWRIVGDSKTLYERYLETGYLPRITSSTFIEPVFQATTRTYTVRWFLNEGDATPIQTIGNIPYGGGNALENPTVKDIHNLGYDTKNILFERNFNPVMVTYNIFNGWNKLPNKINPSVTESYYDIYGVWIHGYADLPSIFSDTTNMTPAQLYVFANMTDAERQQYASVGKQISVTTGYTGIDDSGELLIGPGAAHTMTRYNGQTATYPIARFTNGLSTQVFTSSIQPLMAGSDEFTLAIDYSFGDVSAQAVNTEAVLMACYEKNQSAGVTAGFKLYYYTGSENPGPKISFGDTGVSSGQTTYACQVGTTNTANYRNTIVLRHPAGSNVLYVYSGVNGASNNILTDMKNETTIQELSWENVNTDAYLTFGDISFNNTSTTVKAGKGTIYWAKYWPKDLGVGECRALASWNHELMTYGIEEFSGMDSRYSRFVFPAGGAIPNVVLTSLTSSNYGHIGLRASKAAGDVIQWPNSTLQAVANNRIFLSLPIALQSVITKSPVRSRAATMSSSGYTQTYSIGTSEAVISNDYVFFPSAVEMGLSNEVYKGHEALGSMIWYSGGNTAVHRYNSGTTSWVDDTGNAEYMNLRFPIIPIKTQGINNIYYNYTGSDPIYNVIGGSSVVQRGDIIVTTNGTAYIYATAEDVTAGAVIEPATTTSNAFFYCPTGGWVAADTHWTRSPFDGNGSYGTFMYVNKNGNLQASGIAPASNGYGFNYSFSI